MNLANYTVSNGRDRLSGQLTARGSRMGISTAAGFFFGLPFIGVGTFITLMGLKIVQVDPKNVHAPYPILAVAGLMFFLGGVMIWSMALKQCKENRRRASVQSKQPNNPALADYKWDIKGFTAPRWTAVLKQFTAGAAITLFMSIFNWLAWFAKGGLFIQVFVSVFDAVIIAFWIYAFVVLGRAVKFGTSRIEYTQFPYYTGEKIDIRWLTPTGIGRAESGTFTLRCVQQWYEVSGSGDNRSKQLIQEVQWSAQMSLAAPEQIPPGKAVGLSFDIPENVLSTDMNADKPVFWELSIKLKERGLDFNQTYLVPIYKRVDARPESSPAVA